MCAFHLLHLQWNGCGNEEAMGALSSSLASSTCHIQNLNLSHNRINGRNGSVLAEGLVRNSSVKHLVLDGANHPCPTIHFQRRFNESHTSRTWQAIPSVPSAAASCSTP